MVVTIFVVHCAHYILLAFDTNYIENKNRLNKERHIRNGYAKKLVLGEPTIMLHKSKLGTHIHTNIHMHKHNY